jgi:hypothetical protein
MFAYRDLWVAGSSCGSACNGIAMFNPSSSSSFTNLTSSFAIVYGSGEAGGYLGQDIVEMAGFSVSNQGFAVVNEVSTGLLTSPVSGLMGLAWQALASSGDMPFWQTLASSGAMDSALFAVQLRRYTNASNPSSLEPGGELTLGTTNSSLYTGSIDYLDIPTTPSPSYWSLTLSSLTVQGTAISLGSGATAAIDTGTTNIGGPSSAIQAIYAAIPGSSAATGEWAGYYQYPCSTSVTVTLSFGGNTWTMSSADFKFTSLSSSECIGAFFETSSTTTTGSTPSWIIGDAFLVSRVLPVSFSHCSLTTNRRRKTSTLSSDTTHPLSASPPFLKLLSPRTASTAPSPPQRSVASPRRSPTPTVPHPGSDSVSEWLRVSWGCS